MLKLPEITYPLMIDTIGKTLALGHEIHVDCRTPGCGHHGRINLVMLARKLGMDHSCMDDDLKKHFYCQRCRKAGRPDKDIGFIHKTLTDPVSAWPKQQSAYEKAKGR